MKRAKKFVNVPINYIQFEYDALIFEYVNSKGHQKGEKHVGLWHLHTNPLKPWIYPVLGLSLYLFCYPEVFKGGIPLFEGSQQYNHYSGIFRCLMKSCDPHLKFLGFEANDLASHSCHRGVDTMIAAGCTVSPLIASLYITAG